MPRQELELLQVIDTARVDPDDDLDPPDLGAGRRQRQPADR
jgi:hypothetical protein